MRRRISPGRPHDKHAARLRNGLDNVEPLARGEPPPGVVPELADVVDGGSARYYSLQPLSLAKAAAAGNWSEAKCRSRGEPRMSPITRPHPAYVS